MIRAAKRDPAAYRGNGLLSPDFPDEVAYIDGGPAIGNQDRSKVVELVQQRLQEDEAEQAVPFKRCSRAAHWPEL